MQFLKIGHNTNTKNGTGITVFLFDTPAMGAFWLCGSSPATRELTVLALDSNVSYIDGLVFAGGSAFGLGATDGVMQWFKEQNRGKPTPFLPVPIVPAAGIYDLGESTHNPPTKEEAYEACIDAIENNLAQGRVGAGTGATVGKLIQNTTREKGGIGFAQKQLDNGLEVLAFAVVNCLGDVKDNGKIVAGARWENGEFADCEKQLLSGYSERGSVPMNTTLVAIFTNAFFTKPELQRIAKMACSGMSRAIYPVFTRYDGDLIVTVSLGDHVASETVIATVGAECVREAIVNAVLAAN